MTPKNRAKVPRARDGKARRGALGYKAAAAMPRRRRSDGLRQQGIERNEQQIIGVVGPKKLPTGGAFAR